MYTRTVQGISRTNNNVEAWNRRFNLLVGKNHVNIFAFIEKLQLEERYVRNQRRLLYLGEKTQVKKKKYLANDRRIQFLAEQFEEFLEEESVESEDSWDKGFLKYLQAIGHSARGPWLD